MEATVVESRQGDCINASWMEQRNQFPIRSTAAVLRFGKYVVVDREVHWIDWASIVVLDSISQRFPRRLDGLARLRNRSRDCARATRFVHWRATPVGLHSAKCVLCNEQRCAFASLLWRLVLVYFAMAANERAKSFARSCHRSVCRSDVPNETVQLAAGRDRGRDHRCKIADDHCSNTSLGPDRACCAGFVRCDSS